MGNLKNHKPRPWNTAIGLQSDDDSINMNGKCIDIGSHNYKKGDDKG